MAMFNSYVSLPEGKTTWVLTVQTPKDGVRMGKVPSGNYEDDRRITRITVSISTHEPFHLAMFTDGPTSGE